MTAYAQWVKAIIANDGGHLISNMTPNLSLKGTEAEVDENPNSIRQSFGVNVLRIHSNGTVDTGIQFIFNNLEIGDLIEIECEMRVISGSTPLLKVSEWNTTTLAETYPRAKKPEPNNGQWKRVSFIKPVSILSGTYNHRAFIGLERGTSGIFELRSVRAIAHTKTREPQNEGDRGFYKYVIKKTSGTWALDSGANSPGTLTIPNGYTMILTHPGKYKPTYQITTTRPWQYAIGFTSNSAAILTLICKVIGDDTTASTQFSSLPDGIEIHITVFYKI